MSTEGPYLGWIHKIRAFNGAAEIVPAPPFGKASQYWYDVEVDFPSGRVVCPLLTVSEERESDVNNVIPLKLDSPVFVATVKGQLQLMASERLHVVPSGAAP